MTAGIPAPTEVLGVNEYERLHPNDILTEIGKNCTMGLNVNAINPTAPKVDDVFNYLQTLNYEPKNPQNIDIWDCLERALWGVAHALHRFPGCAIGVAEGTAKVGPATDKDHAVIIIWEKGLGSFIYWDPLLPAKKLTPDEFGPIVRIEAFPPGVGFDNMGKQPAPITDEMTRIGKGKFVCWKTGYKLYPLKVPKEQGRNGIEDYLNVPLYENSCIDIGGHQPGPKDGDPFWGPRSRALWSYIHVRRVYESCAIGIAFGEPEKGKSPVVNVLWQKDGDKYKRIYWDPTPEILKEVSFKPTTMFF